MAGGEHEGCFGALRKVGQEKLDEGSMTVIDKIGGVGLDGGIDKEQAITCNINTNIYITKHGEVLHVVVGAVVLLAVRSGKRALRSSAT